MAKKKLTGLMQLLILLAAGFASASPTWRVTTPDKKSHAGALHRLLEHPSFSPGTPSIMSHHERVQFSHRVRRNIFETPARLSLDRRAYGDLARVWQELRPIISARYGIDFPVSLNLAARGTTKLLARALPDNSLIAHRGDLEYSRSIARAVATVPSGNVHEILDNLAIVAASARVGRYRVTFGDLDRARYRRTLNGVLVSTIGHELGHLIGDHPGLDFDTDPRPLKSKTTATKRLAAYLPRKFAKQLLAEDAVYYRPLFVAQAMEADADRVALDLAVAGKIDTDGIIAEHLVSAMMSQGDDNPLERIHPPEKYRFDDALTRLKAQKIPSIADTVSRNEMNSAMERATFAEKLRSNSAPFGTFKNVAPNMQITLRHPSTDKLETATIINTYHIPYAALRNQDWTWKPKAERLTMPVADVRFADGTEIQVAANRIHLSRKNFGEQRRFLRQQRKEILAAVASEFGLKKLNVPIRSLRGARSLEEQSTGARLGPYLRFVTQDGGKGAAQLAEEGTYGVEKEGTVVVDRFHGAFNPRVQVHEVLHAISVHFKKALIDAGETELMEGITDFFAYTVVSGTRGFVPFEGDSRKNQIRFAQALARHIGYEPLKQLFVSSEKGLFETLSSRVDGQGKKRFAKACRALKRGDVERAIALLEP